VSDRSQLRREGKASRETLSAEMRVAFSRQITQRIAASPQFQSADTVMIYRALPCEVDLSGLETYGKRLVYPRCISKTDMIALLPNDEDGWIGGAFGIMEPDPDKSLPIPPEEIDLVICPCTAFDEACTRMGMGAGYYDRFLLKCVNAFIAAAAFECQKTPSVPAEPWDIPMDCVFTEQTVYYSK